MLLGHKRVNVAPSLLPQVADITAVDGSCSTPKNICGSEPASRRVLLATVPHTPAKVMADRSRGIAPDAESVLVPAPQAAPSRARGNRSPASA